MNTPKIEQNFSTGIGDDKSERGTAIVIALFVLALIGVFVALALSRTASEAAAVGNETSEARTLYAAQGGLETMTRNFNKIFERNLNPTAAELALVRNPDVVPGLSKALGGEYDFNQELLCVKGTSADCAVSVSAAESTVVLSDEAYSGLYAIRDSWRLRSTATAPDGTQLELTRNILNNRIPIFQFGIFYEDDLELFRPPRFSFGGRVHSNRHFFLSPGDEGIYFDSRVTTSGHIVTQTWRNWFTGDSGNARTFIKDASGDDQQLFPSEGSVLNGTPNIFAANPDMPSSRLNPDFADDSEKFDGNLQNLVPVLNLPLNVGANTDLIEMVKRGKEIATPAGGDLFRNNTTGATDPVTAPNVDNPILRSERFANKTGIRVSLADSKAKLPGCASGLGIAAVLGPCGVRIDGHAVPTALGNEPDGTAPITSGNRARGYRPLAMTDGYQATRVNGERLFVGGRQVWIKVETVRTDEATQNVITTDITEDILSLGLTEQAVPLGTGTTLFQITHAGFNNTLTNNAQITSTTVQPPPVGTDSRSIIKLQRFVIPGGAIPGTSNAITSSAGNYSVVMRYGGVDTDLEADQGCVAPATCTTAAGEDNGSVSSPNENLGHLRRATVNGVANKAVVPFPIKMFDMREGYYFDSRTTAFYNLNHLTRNGVMSMIDIDLANLRRFLRGDFNGLFPTTTTFALNNANVGLRACTYQTPAPTPCDIPERNGWVLYVSDRRGDANFDGEFDMEDIYGAAPGNDGNRQTGEDLDGPTTGPPGFVPRFGAGVLDARYVADNVLTGEAERYGANTATPDVLAVNDHRYYRRGVRLINGTTLPGIYDAATPANTKGFTVASENGVYVRGNYNATSVTAPSGTANTPYNQYFPFNQSTHIPASVVADSVTILSNAWEDARSFWSPVTNPYDQSNRIASETHMRFAMISGDTIASRETTPHQGGISPKLNGGVHNFKRFLERWTGQRLNYAGSLINLYNSRNNNGSFKCCNTVYNPPTRNWVFDSTFLDPGRLPPGTPFFQYVQTTGFQRSTD